MEISRKWRFSCLLLGLFFLATTLQGVQGEVESEGPSESECRPFIEKALKELETADTEHVDPGAPADDDDNDSKENAPDVEGTTDDSAQDASAGEDDTENGDKIESSETQQDDGTVDASAEQADEPASEQDEKSAEEPAEEEAKESGEKVEDAVSGEATEDAKDEESTEGEAPAESVEEAADEPQAESQEAQTQSKEKSDEDAQESHDAESEHDTQPETEEDTKSAEEGAAGEEQHEGSQEQAVESEEAQEEQEEQAHSQEDAKSEDEGGKSQEDDAKSQEEDAKSQEDDAKSQEEDAKSQEEDVKSQEEDAKSHEEESKSQEDAKSEDEDAKPQEEDDKSQEEGDTSQEEAKSHEEEEEKSPEEEGEKSQEAQSLEEEEKAPSVEDQAESQEQADAPAEESAEQEDAAKSGEEEAGSVEAEAEAEGDASAETAEVAAESDEKTEDAAASAEEAAGSTEEAQSAETAESIEKVDIPEVGSEEAKESAEEPAEGKSTEEPQADEAAEEEPAEEGGESKDEESKEEVPEEDLTLEIDIPENLRPRDHIDQLLKLDESNMESEAVLSRFSDVTLRELKKLYEGAIKPLETLYKYRDLSNRHFGDSEIFSKPLVLFMGPWSGGKSSIINYLVNNEYNTTSLRTGAEPSPAYFNILMHGDEPEVLDGTQLAADFTFAGLQKFGQGLEERLRGLKLPNTLLEKINIVEIPGILEVRKQVSRVFPFNDACQWFIDRADIIFLVYDPSKLDVGPETEAILDQLKGREHQTRIVLNKADQVKPEELMRVQGALIWNISPLMSSAQPPVMYTTSLWSRPYETWAPVRLLQAQERSFLRDLRSAVDKRIENKISSARRFAVRVRNHAKMVDCYLTTYYNHKSVFGNRKQVSDQIIEHPQDYHIYEGLSTLTNISRYDLPDPDVYKDFFRLNPLYDFQQLSATCTYFRGCPINRLDVAIAYDLPEMLGKHKKLVESALTEKKTAS